MENEEAPSDALIELLCSEVEAKAAAGIGTDETAKTPARTVEIIRGTKVFADLVDDIIETLIIRMGSIIGKYIQ